eukprot:Nk52_evm2s390 gene=Nk52_evmTU2s390
MIYYVMVSRTSDGLPLVASMETSDSTEPIIKENKKLAKAIAKCVKKCSQPLVTVSCDGDYVYHLEVKGSLSFLVLCSGKYPRPLAVCMIRELWEDFSGLVTEDAILSARRPYCCISFDSVIQKVKSRYQNVNTLKPKVNLEEISAELNKNTTPKVTVEELTGKKSSGLRHRQNTSSVTGISSHIHKRSMKGSPSGCLNVWPFNAVELRGRAAYDLGIVYLSVLFPVLFLIIKMVALNNPHGVDVDVDGPFTSYYFLSAIDEVFLFMLIPFLVCQAYCFLKSLEVFKIPGISMWGWALFRGICYCWMGWEYHGLGSASITDGVAFVFLLKGFVILLLSLFFLWRLSFNPLFDMDCSQFHID